MRLSASKIKSLDLCSWKFWCNFFLKLPEIPHPKTNAGSVVHNVMEMLMKEQHRHHFAYICENNYFIPRNIERYMYNWIRYYKIDSEVAEAIPDMLIMACKYLHELGALDDPNVVKIYPEYEFTLKNEHYEIKGFIDVLVVYKDKCLIVDYKSQGQKFTKEEMEFNVQGLIYQLAVWQHFQMLADAEFVMLRHPPTERKPQNHIQKVDAPEPSLFPKLESYLAYMQGYLNSFIEEGHAKSKFARWSPKSFFCKYVCQFKEPTTYYTAEDQDENIVRSDFNDSQELRKLAQEKKLIIKKKEYNGCPAFQ